jgi:hypothetical protein
LIESIAYDVKKHQEIHKDVVGTRIFNIYIYFFLIFNFFFIIFFFKNFFEPRVIWKHGRKDVEVGWKRKNNCFLRQQKMPKLIDIMSVKNVDIL